MIVLMPAPEEVSSSGHRSQPADGGAADTVGKLSPIPGFSPKPDTVPGVENEEPDDEHGNAGAPVAEGNEVEEQAQRSNGHPGAIMISVRPYPRPTLRVLHTRRSQSRRQRGGVTQPDYLTSRQTESASR
jgi:hypothetical protein